MTLSICRIRAVPQSKSALEANDVLAALIHYAVHNVVPIPWNHKFSPWSAAVQSAALIRLPKTAVFDALAKIQPTCIVRVTMGVTIGVSMCCSSRHELTLTLHVHSIQVAQAAGEVETRNNIQLMNFECRSPLRFRLL